MRPIRLVFISTNALTRSGITQIVLRSEHPIEVVGTFSDFPTTRHYMDKNPVDVIFIDEALPPNTDLLRQLRVIRAEYVGIAVIAILPRPTASLVQQMLAHGVRGLLHKSDALEQNLVQAIVLGKQRGIYLSPSISHFINSPQKLPTTLNQREFDVLKLLADGLEPKAIAHQVGIGSNSVYRILHLMREAFHAQNNAHLIKITHQLKLFDSSTFD